ncbi:MAG TPA: TlpA disulfide reductase family protein [Flavobacteriales bacterium]|nr:TlpA disulfide reductase family protein [Flavobacteriales bacterium]
MKNIFVLLLIVAQSCLLHAQDDPHEVLQNAYATLNKKKSVGYKATLRMKMFDNADTLERKAWVHIERNTTDTMFGARLFLNFTGGNTQIYDLQNIYQLSPKEQKGTRYPAKLDWAINGNVNARVVWSDFIEPQNILNRLDTANKIKLLGDTLIHKTKCWKIAIRYPDEDDEWTDQKRIMCISKKDYVPVFTSFQIKYQGNYQYDALTITAVEFDKQKATDLAERVLKNYTIEDYKEPTPEEQAEMYRLLDTNTLAPVLKGKIYGSAEAITEIDYTGKIVMLDFWYMACGWCIKSFPYIEKLREKYGDKLTVYGVNSFDNSEKGIAKMPQFLEFNPMKYQTVMVNKDFIDACKVKAWPTFYLIGPDGKVKYAHAGAIVDDKSMGEWEREIEKLMK